MASGKQPNLSYADAGVNIDAGNELVQRIKASVKATQRPEVMTGLGGFGGLFQLNSSAYKEPVLVSGTDGVGTKLMLARQFGRHDGIGIDLVAMCVNDILTLGAEPLFFLDYYACGKLDLAQAEAVIAGIATGCRQAGCSLIGGETAEMPGMYTGEDYDLAGFTVGVVDKPKLIDGSRIQPGHRLLGLASSGPHSNGYSLIRKVLELSGADENTRLGQDKLSDLLLEPTRIYVQPVLALLKTHSLDGLAHITGGGLLENISRILPPGCGIRIQRQAWDWPPVFRWLQEKGGIETKEMLRTFNCGIGMVLLCHENEAEAVAASAREAGERVWEIGKVTADTSSRVEFL